MITILSSGFFSAVHLALIVGMLSGIYLLPFLGCRCLWKSLRR